MKPSGFLGPLEGEIMEVMWEKEHATVRDMLSALRRELAYTTVMTVMNNLVTKGLLERTPHGKAYHYTVVLSREAFLDREAQEAVGQVLERFGDLAITRFLEKVAQLDPDDLERLKRMAKGMGESQTGQEV